ncbi:MAG: transketolase [Ignavibacteriaceae bacterium]|nr:transketolase [Ignavibacteriaceae bacterium]
MNYENKLLEIAKSDDRIVILTAENRAAIRNIPNNLADRFVDVGIAEQTLVGIAAGLALRKRIPIVHALASFLTMRAFEFIRTDVGISNLPVKIVGSFAGFSSEANGPTHQALEDVSLMRGIPNMNVFCPADEEDMILGLPEIISTPSPFYIRFNSIKPIYPHEKFEIGKAEVIGSGTDIAILVYGTLFNQALIAKNNLEKLGISLRVLNLRTLKPIDKSEILKTVEECDLIITLEDHFITGGLFSILSEILVLHKKNADIFPIALNNTWFKPALFDEVLEYEGFTAENLVQKILNALHNKKLVRVHA